MLPTLVLVGSVRSAGDYLAIALTRLRVAPEPMAELVDTLGAPVQVETVGLEPTTITLQGWCSPSLSYAPVVEQVGLEPTN